MKRLFDILFAIIIIFFISIPVIFLILIIINKIGRPIFFIQERSGLNGKPFKMIKFRTMSNIYDEDDVLINDSDRILKFGAFLRSTSLDELPELWNVLKGEMSFVGPRPLLLQYLPLYSKKQFLRHNVKPGITGWAQVNGRNLIDWEEKFNYDLWYVYNQSFLLDIYILWKTIWVVFKKEGINDLKNSTMPPFKG
jgi:sugar transferase EpsL